MSDQRGMRNAKRTAKVITLGVGLLLLGGCVVDADTVFVDAVAAGSQSLLDALLDGLSASVSDS